MTTEVIIDSKDEIDKIAQNLLKCSKALGRFPTPIDDIVKYADLFFDTSIDLGTIDSGFITKKLRVLNSALSKVLGIAIPSKKVIYLDLSMIPARKNFVKLHETGHHVLPWQAGLCDAFEDDQYSLDEYTKELFEQEASYFASSVLFQVDGFTTESKKLPLSMNSAMYLAQQFGSSYHAALRRYVEFSHKRCALLVLELPEIGNSKCCKVRNIFTSVPFKQSFGELNSVSHCGQEYEFVKDYIYGKKNHENGSMKPFEGSIFSNSFSYHYFTNSYNIFILIFPDGEQIKSRKIIQLIN